MPVSAFDILFGAYKLGYGPDSAMLQLNALLYTQEMKGDAYLLFDMYKSGMEQKPAIELLEIIKRMTWGDPWDIWTALRSAMNTPPGPLN